MELVKALEVLGLDWGASQEEIREAYRDLAAVWHPDKYRGNERLRAKAEAKLKEINLAYDVLRGIDWSGFGDEPDFGDDEEGGDEVYAPDWEYDEDVEPVTADAGAVPPDVQRSRRVQMIASIIIGLVGLATIVYYALPMVNWPMRPNPQQSIAATPATFDADVSYDSNDLLSGPEEYSLSAEATRLVQNFRRKYPTVRPGLSDTELATWIYNLYPDAYPELAPPNRDESSVHPYLIRSHRTGRIYRITFSSIPTNDEIDDACRLADAEKWPTYDGPDVADLDRFTLGDTEERVRRIQGVPTSVNRYGDTLSLSYGGARVMFENGVVKEYMDYTGRTLKVELLPKRLTGATTFTMGSTVDEVLEAQGTPSGVSFYYDGSSTFHYLGASVQFEGGRVAEYSDYRGVLRVR